MTQLKILFKKTDNHKIVKIFAGENVYKPLPFLSLEICHVNHLQDLKKFRWSVKIVKHRKKFKKVQKI